MASPCGTALDPQVYFGVPWRSLVTSLTHENITFLDRLASERTVNYVLNGPGSAGGQVPSGSPEVNIPWDDGYPFLNQSNRLLHLFRREGAPTCWVPRWTGVILNVEDQAGSDNATTSYTAYDPWQILRHKPLVDPITLDLPDADGVTFKNTDVGTIVTTVLDAMWIYLSGLTPTDPHMDAFLDWGQSGFYTGTIEHTGLVTWMNFDQSSTVGDVFDKLVATGLSDIVITPIFDPLLRPGIIGEVNVYQLAGSHLNNMVMAWDMPSRSLVGIDPLYDGDSLLNMARYSPAQGPSRPLVSNAASVARNGGYWEQDMFTGTNAYHEVDVVAVREVGFRSDGKTTYDVQPIPGRAPVPLLEYGLGDQLPVWSSNKMRRAIGPTLSTGVWEEMARVYGISMAIGDDDMERVERLTLSKDGGV